MNDRDTEIIDAVKAGRTLQAQADKWGLSRERVRQICAAAGVKAPRRGRTDAEPASPMRAERRETTRARLVARIDEGYTAPQAAEACECSANHARKLLTPEQLGAAWINTLRQRRARQA